tara:strand:+ start:64 stop:690 length:627 start_codon:yes stop_codon:yes gene_type:complete
MDQISKYTFDELDLTDRYELLSSLPKHFKVGAEIGVWEGWYTFQILERTNMHIFAIDPWADTKGYPDPPNKDKDFDPLAVGPDGFVWHETRYMSTYANLMNAPRDRWTIFRSFSYDTVYFFEDKQMDFVYIDGDHLYDAVIKDMRDWWPKVNIGGILAGHDYNDNNPGTIQAVNEFAIQNNLEFKVTGTSPEKGDADAPSWVFIRNEE